MLPSAVMHDIGNTVQEVRERIARAARRSGRDGQEVELIAVSKTVVAERAQLAVDAGIRALGENRVQEADDKIPRVFGNIAWHLIGRLQSNKARRAASLFDAVHSLDRVALARRLAAAAAEQARTLDVYVQVEFVRQGLGQSEILEMTRELCLVAAGASGLRLRGLMTLPPFDRDPERARPWFRKLRDLRDQIAADTGLSLPSLSMGMSNDFEIAVEEGATAVRVGSAIFGARL